jgi:S-adenosylmethionine synthetase
MKLNVEVPRNLASLAKSLDFTLVYISTGVPFTHLQSHANSGFISDYVFDGKAPPYTPTALTNPLQAYGKSKRDGEVEVLKAGEQGASVVVLRVPIL